MSDTATERYRESYASQGYCLIKALLTPPVVRRVLIDIAEDVERVGLDKFLGKTTIHSLPGVEIYSHDYKYLNALQWGVTGLVRDITNINLTPSFAYFQIYQRGNRLFVHSDRHSCEHSLSLTLGYSDNIPWDLTVSKERVDLTNEAEGKKFADDHQGADYYRVSTSPGDAVLYPGNLRRHGRLEPNPNRWSAHIFMHWVDADGPNADLAFDKKDKNRLVDFNIPRV